MSHSLKRFANPKLPTSAENKPAPSPTLRRVSKSNTANPAKLIAYDFETTRIEAGTPRPLYITAYSEVDNFVLEEPINNMLHLRELLLKHFLTKDFENAKFIAWNANNFDAYFIAAALITDIDYVIRPYLTRSKSLRGLRIHRAVDLQSDGTFTKKSPSWEFLDGMSMLGLAGTPLSKFLKNFAPEYTKLEGVINFEKETFNCNNKSHREYALRDSVGLYYAMNNAQNILIDNFNQPLTVTMGGACIKIFTANIPKDTFINTLKENELKIVREYVMRGGYCYCVNLYHGKVWKYDLNQAYAAAMREAKLPCGGVYHTAGINKKATVYIAKVTATHKTNIIPFYYRTDIAGRIKSQFTYKNIFETWLTSIEIDQLIQEGWDIKFIESYYFQEYFAMNDYVNGLEKLRMNCEGGPSGPIGLMVKAVGNHSYGKTAEQLEAIEYLMSGDLPNGYIPYFGDNLDPLENIYYRFTPIDEQRGKAYHKPQISSFITAHVRMVVRRAALISPETWLYADTDCVIFSSDVTEHLDIDSKRYGAWKIEESGTEYQILAKKVYRNIETESLHAKGLNVRHLTPEHFDNWFDGTPPEQYQNQRQNFMQVMRGAEMYKKQRRKGTDLKNVSKAI